MSTNKAKESIQQGVNKLSLKGSCPIWPVDTELVR
jgi:hypothetical protein